MLLSFWGKSFFGCLGTRPQFYLFQGGPDLLIVWSWCLMENICLIVVLDYPLCRWYISEHSTPQVYFEHYNLGMIKLNRSKILEAYYRSHLLLESQSKLYWLLLKWNKTVISNHVILACINIFIYQVVLMCDKHIDRTWDSKFVCLLLLWSQYQAAFVFFLSISIFLWHA